MPRPRSLTTLLIAATALAMFVAFAPAASGQIRASADAVPTAVTSAPWPRPAVPNAIRIGLHVGTDTLHLKDSRNYILRMPKVKKTGPLYIRGGGNVRLIGGLMSTKIKGPNIVIMDDSGTRNGRIVHIEGLLINGSSRVPSDGIKIKAPHTIVQLEHDRIVGLHGSLRGYHADVVQPGGGVKELLIDDFTGSSHYNNFYFRRETNPLMPAIGRVIIENTNMFGYQNPGTIPRRTLRGISIGTQPDPPSNDSSALNCKVTNALWMKNFWVRPPRGTRPAQFVYPHDRMEGLAARCDSAYKSSTHSVDWPHLRASNGGEVHGVVHVGTHRAFVRARTVGLNYRG